MPTSPSFAPRILDFVLSEAEGFRSRTNAVVTQTGTAIKSGTVMSKLASGKWVPYTNVSPSDVAAGVIYTPLVAKTGDSKAVIFDTACEVRRVALTGQDTTGEADLLLQGIKVRGTASLPGVASVPAL